MTGVFGIVGTDRTHLKMELETSFICAYCFSVNQILVDASGGLRQDYTEDCQVCCRPNRLTIVIDEDLSGAEATAEPE